LISRFIAFSLSISIPDANAFHLQTIGMRMSRQDMESAVLESSMAAFIGNIVQGQDLVAISR
jgi:hypothetical protein